ncbi:unnamed protein product [Rotaria sp. Silwood1]|nr:unnamed protein product [Rotaria sp. Silwood1]CAF4814551.1 unnamed protein product [Rotaria sp. Silwood1]CAF4822878.1 unnamed protein product [Rotaria sp. Silwood1]CAF4925188.1 unnamed protein product [Rotaria sp. Silwood1]
MRINTKYRYSYYERERFQNEQDRRQQEEENKRRLAAFIIEEEQRQLAAYRNDSEFIWNRLIPASPSFIAQFRLMALRQVNYDLFEASCTICLEKFNYGEYYAEWPCEARHIFHHNYLVQLFCEHLFIHTAT